MEEVRKIIKDIYLKIKQIEENNSKYGIELSTYLNELYLGLNLENQKLYRVPEKMWKDVLYKEVEKLNDLTDENIYEQVKKSFKNYGEIFLLKDINDSNIPLEFGVEMEKLYFDPNTIVGVHGTTISGDKIEDTIFEEGLFCNYGPRICATVNIQDEDILPFNRFMKYVYKANNTEQAIIVCIPKDMINSPMWRKEGESYILTPSFIYGYYTPHFGAQFNSNPEIIHNKKYGSEITEEYSICDEFMLEEYNDFVR